MWVTFLALKDRDGIVHSTLPGMKKDSGLTLEEAAHAIKVLEDPDLLTNTQEFEGRRIKKIKDGWLVLNHQYYKDMIQDEQRRRYNAEKQREYRLKEKLEKKRLETTTRGTPLTGETGNEILEKNGATAEQLDRHEADFLPKAPDPMDRYLETHCRDETRKPEAQPPLRPPVKDVPPPVAPTVTEFDSSDLGERD